MEAFDGDGRDDLPLLEVGKGCGAVWRLGEVSWVRLLKACEEVDLSEGELHSCRWSVEVLETVLCIFEDVRSG